MKPIFKILIIIIALSAASCRKDYYGQKPIPAGPVSFNGIILPILTQNCAKSGCHVAGGQSPDLTSSNAYDNLTGSGVIDTLQPATCTLYQHLTGAGGLKLMPPDGKLNSFDLALILTWIKQGAQND